MIPVLLIAAGLLALGWFAGVSRAAIVSVLAVLFLAVLLIQITLPESSGLRQHTGGSLRAWLILLGIAGLVAAYALAVRTLKRRAPAPPVSPAPEGPFSEAELERYARHIVLREIGGAGQQRLKSARVMVIGAGGLGSPLLMYMAAAGVGVIGIVDDDVVSLSNLQRQVLHSGDRIGMPKVLSAEKGLMAINPNIRVLSHNRRLDAANAETLLADFDLVLDGSDNFATRQLVNRAAVALELPLIAAAISQWEGQISLYHPKSGTPCYACIFPEAPAEGLAPTCAEAGVMGALPGVMGSMMAVEAIKAITGAGQGLRGEMLIYDALYGESRKVRIVRRDDCPVCGSAAG